MAYEVVMSYHLHMPSYFLGTFTEYPEKGDKEQTLPPFLFFISNQSVCNSFQTYIKGQ